AAYYIMRQFAGAAALQQLGPRAAPAIPRLIGMLDHPERADAALVALLAVRPTAERDILGLTNCFGIQKGGTYRSDPASLHGLSLLALSTFGPKASNAVPFLVAASSSTNVWVRGCSAAALARIGAPPDQVVPLVIRSLTTNTPAFARPPPAVFS